MPEPKALCASCGRPIVLAKAAKCLYCGASVAGLAEPVIESGKLPPEVLIALEPRAEEGSRMRKWMVRIAAALLGSTIAGALLMGSCVGRAPHS